MEPAAPTVEMLDPGTLHAFPHQEKIYGACGLPRDPYFDDFVANVKEHGVRVPILVARDTPGVPDGTVISGHRRFTAAIRCGLTRVPVLVDSFASYDHARHAHLLCNKQRVKDEWVKSNEATAWWDVKASMAAAAKLAGQKNGGIARHGQLAPAEQGKADRHANETAAMVGAEMGEGRETATLRKALVEAAEAQNPTAPEQSPIAVALKAGAKPKTVAREHGVKPAPRKLTGSPLAKKPKAIDSGAFEYVASELRDATTHAALGKAYGLASSVNGLTSEQTAALAALYQERSAALQAEKERAAVAVTARSHAADAFVAACAGAEKRLRTMLESAAPEAIAAADRAACVAAVDTLIGLLRSHRDQLTEKASAA